MARVGSTKGTEEYVTAWERPGTVISLSAKFNERSPNYNEVLRFVCHHVLENIPNEGLTELSETLRDMLEFHLERATISSIVKLPNTITESATYGKKYTRDTFYVTED